ncbi:S-adenosyl-L-methionine-dependent methyltransferase [Clohesyomyces aquaticus]|uniref:S-adenosyl-L-methionine-dependent methyltransferase n=1 Tax=Clohesyomyces aquaticus TaxID=1231657 RepID=A0A1Y1Z6F5_9PLEO|nr:S-adenosyl-L-methionine-dependent methyltransferase [Clohesyomyces aquaticus]
MATFNAPLGDNEITMKTGKGNYNEHALLQARAIEPALALLPDLSSHASISIVDYGCSQGSNSLIPLKALLSTLPANSTVSLTLNDQPFNDWNTVSRTLHSREDEITRGGDLKLILNISPNSFYNQVIQDASVDIALSWSALSYLQHYLPTPPFSSLPEMVTRRKQRNTAQAHIDLINLLRLRALEIKKGGYFIATLGGMKEGDGGENIASAPTTYAMMKALQDLVAAGTMTTTQLLGMDPPIHERTVTELRGSLDSVSDLWTIQHISTQTIIHPAWDSLQASQKSEQDYKEYAESIVDWVFSAFEWYIIKGLRVAEEEKGPRKPVTDEERMVLDDLIERCKKYVREEFKDLPCQVEYLYFKLVRN